MIEVEVFGAALASRAPSPAEVRRLCAEAAASAGVRDGHVAIEFVDTGRIAQLNAEHRGRPRPTDVLSFPIDGTGPIDGAGPIVGAESVEDGRAHPFERAGRVERELGDIVICPEHTTDLREAIVHGMLHLLGMDHETDDGEMLALQCELLRQPGSSGMGR
jgi:probable rRNA maturation factor